MIRAAVLAAVLAVCVCGLTFETDPYWAAYKAQFGKVYPSRAVEQGRHAAFQTNMADAAHYNTVDPTATYSWTDRSDRPVSELFAPLEVPRNIVRTIPRMTSTGPLPEAYDWRALGAVTPVQDQGQCGSCWAFCAVASMEGAHFLKYKQLLKLSESQVVDCDKNDHGCNGGWPTTATDWIKGHGGIMLSKDYPYVARQQVCYFDESKVAMKVAQSYTFTARNPAMMKKALVEHGPLSVAVDARKFNSYSTGIMSASGCNAGAPTHGITAVGWGLEGAAEYWIVKNSWGVTWGEKGYVRMALGVNACGVEDYPMGVDAV